jgi:5-methylcytosine-specific restriction endonuclease McrA
VYTAEKVLLLNASEEVINVISWHRAALLLLKGKAKRPHAHEEVYEIPLVQGVFRLPTVLVLIRYVRIPFRRLAPTRENLLSRDGFACQYCGKSLTLESATVDHVVPTSRGGSRSWNNTVASCKACNNRKGNRTPYEAGMRLKREPFAPAKHLVLITAVGVKINDGWRRWVPN